MLLYNGIHGEHNYICLHFIKINDNVIGKVLKYPFFFYLFTDRSFVLSEIPSGTKRRFDATNSKFRTSLKQMQTLIRFC